MLFFVQYLCTPVWGNLGPPLPPWHGVGHAHHLAPHPAYVSTCTWVGGHFYFDYITNVELNHPASPGRGVIISGTNPAVVFWTSALLLGELACPTSDLGHSMPPLILTFSQP